MQDWFAITIYTRKWRLWHIKFASYSTGELQPWTGTWVCLHQKSNTQSYFYLGVLLPGRRADYIRPLYTGTVIGACFGVDWGYGTNPQWILHHHFLLEEALIRACDLWLLQQADTLFLWTIICAHSASLISRIQMPGRAACRMGPWLTLANSYASLCPCHTLPGLILPQSSLPIAWESCALMYLISKTHLIVMVPSSLCWPICGIEEVMGEVSVSAGDPATAACGQLVQVLQEPYFMDTAKDLYPVGLSQDRRLASQFQNWIFIFLMGWDN